MYSRILVPVDGSPTSDRGVQEAVKLAGALRGTLVVLNVVSGYPLLVEMASTQSFEEALGDVRRYGETAVDKACQIARTQGVAADGVVREVKSGHIADAILQEARDRPAR